MEAATSVLEDAYVRARKRRTLKRATVVHSAPARTAMKWPAVARAVFHVLLLTVYVALGGVIFRGIEGPHEQKLWDEQNATAFERASAVQQSIVDNLISNVDCRNIDWRSRWYERCSFVLEAVKEAIQHSREEKEPLWDFRGSVFYSYALCTTIGSTHQAPQRVAGQVVALIYAILGILLFVLSLFSTSYLLASLLSIVNRPSRCYVGLQGHQADDGRYRRYAIWLIIALMLVFLFLTALLYFLTAESPQGIEYLKHLYLSFMFLLATGPVNPSSVNAAVFFLTTYTGFILLATFIRLITRRLSTLRSFARELVVERAAKKPSTITPPSPKGKPTSPLRRKLSLKPSLSVGLFNADKPQQWLDSYVEKLQKKHVSIITFPTAQVISGSHVGGKEHATLQSRAPANLYTDLPVWTSKAGGVGEKQMQTEITCAPGLASLLPRLSVAKPNHMAVQARVESLDDKSTQSTGLLLCDSCSTTSPSITSPPLTPCSYSETPVYSDDSSNTQIGGDYNFSLGKRVDYLEKRCSVDQTTQTHHEEWKNHPLEEFLAVHNRASVVMEEDDVNAADQRLARWLDELQERNQRALHKFPTLLTPLIRRTSSSGGEGPRQRYRRRNGPAQQNGLSEKSSSTSTGTQYDNCSMDRKVNAVPAHVAVHRRKAMKHVSFTNDSPPPMRTIQESHREQSTTASPASTLLRAQQSVHSSAQGSVDYGFSTPLLSPMNSVVTNASSGEQSICFENQLVTAFHGGAFGLEDDSWFPGCQGSPAPRERVVTAFHGGAFGMDDDDFDVWEQGPSQAIERIVPITVSDSSPSPDPLEKQPETELYLPYMRLCRTVLFRKTY